MSMKGVPSLLALAFVLVTGTGVSDDASVPGALPPLRVPEGFRAKEGTVAEPYTKTAWAKEIVHKRTGIELAFIPAGEFTMGSPQTESGHRQNEGPVHRVRITKPFYMGKYEVTQGEWLTVMDANRSHFQGSPRLPMDRVSRRDCDDFIVMLGDGLKLPTEAQWEYACRAGTTTPFNTGETISAAEANYKGDDVYGKGRKGVYRKKTVAAGGFKPNAWGLHDMHGNVWEWCSDWYREDYYADSPVDDPEAPKVGKGWQHVFRGGSWVTHPTGCRCAFRMPAPAHTRDANVGLRLSLDLE